MRADEGQRRYSSPPISAFPYDPVRLICENCGRRGQYRKATLLERYGDLAGPDMLVAVADCPRHKALGEERCGVVYEDLLQRASF